MLDKFLAPMIDNLLATYGLTRADVYKLHNEALSLLDEARMNLPGLLARFAEMEKALHTQTAALTILLDEKNRRDQLETFLERKTQPDKLTQAEIAAKAGQDINGYPLIENAYHNTLNGESHS